MILHFCERRAKRWCHVDVIEIPDSDDSEAQYDDDDPADQAQRAPLQPRQQVGMLARHQAAFVHEWA